ncbi:MAG: radical SAM protein [Thermodesulfobacteria bacterium]|nr:radical SAM protein [Thermodesulfobacteriota bacterium]
MRIGIVIPPWLHPCSPPLGPAALSAFLKREHPRAKIQIFDLNLYYYQEALSLMNQGLLGLKLYDWDAPTTAGKVMESVDFLKTHPLSSVSISRWHQMATIFLSFENVFNGFMAEMAGRSLLGMEIPGVIDGFFNRIVSSVVAFEPGLCGISVFFDAQMVFALEISRRIKEETDAFICLGGARFGTCPRPERLFKRPLRIRAKGENHALESLPFVDAIIPGEGEIPMVELARNLPLSKIRDVPGLVFKTSSQVVTNDPPPLLSMNELPAPDFSDFHLEGYLTPEPVLPFMTSRGCAWGKCTFCTHHRIYRKYRQMNIQTVLRQMDGLKDSYETSLFSLFDEMIPPARARNLAKAMLNKGLNLKFSAYAKPVKPFNETLLKLLAQAGCRLMMWGVESGSQRILDLMKKGTKVKDMEEVLMNSSKAGIRNLIFIMFGFPGETEADFNLTISFLKRNSNYIDAISKGIFVLIEGCEVHRRPDKFFITRMQPKSDNWSGAMAYSFETDAGLDQKQVLKLYKEHLPLIEKIGLSPRLGVYREHLLF